eukprot:TRINITY_DN299_c0_g4_i2.p1 TRINITY_DN299_c0_g4~~TRINITY_DN299_c0_g4_i2.p1  ORF type:complete len:325 (-),score=94.33 TRINITY_DN299_c0_g4_i2:234-1208(-)
MDEFEFASDSSISYGKAMIAGAAAGVMEHVFMFPVDTIKTLMQAPRVGCAHTQCGTVTAATPASASAAAAAAVQHQPPQYRTMSEVISEVRRTEGFRRLYRGVGAVLLGAIPSHAVHFGTYELAKEHLGGNRAGHHPLINALSGACATMAHDAVVTPLDVLKQRMQIHGDRYGSLLRCARHVVETDGLGAFYRSYPTTLAMNVPFMAVYFATYESFKQALRDKSGELGTLQHFIAGGGAGALGGMFSTPLDVIKTRIQLGTDGGRKYSGALDVIRSIHKEEGWRGFTRGMPARVLYFMPSAAVCWTTYETVKIFLKFSTPSQGH